MATELLDGLRTWSGNIDADGHRTWFVTFRTRGSRLDGPASHIQTPGLPVEGSIWAIGNDLDIWAWCRSGPTNIKPVEQDGRIEHFDSTFTFSTRPPGQGGLGGPGSGGSSGAGGSSPSGGQDQRGAKKKCADSRIEDPLMEPPTTSGSTIRWTEEATVDRLGAPIVYTSFEPIRGQLAEFEEVRDQVIVEQNVLNLEYKKMTEIRNTVNDAPLWDLAERFWRLADWSWSRKLYGTCSFYYTRRLTLESWAVRDRDPNSTTFGQLISGWDKQVLDESSKVLDGYWAEDGSWVENLIGGLQPDPLNANHYINAFDKNFQPCRQILSHADKGRPAVDKDDANYIRIEKYDESDFAPLDLPLTL